MIAYMSLGSIRRPDSNADKAQGHVDALEVFALISDVQISLRKSISLDVS